MSMPSFHRNLQLCCSKYLITWWGIVVRIGHPPLSRLLLLLLFNFSPSRLVQCLFFTLVFAHLSAFHMFNFFWCLPFPPSSSHLLQPPRPFSLSLFRPLLLSLSHSCILSLSRSFPCVCLYLSVIIITGLITCHYGSLGAYQHGGRQENERCVCVCGGVMVEGYLSTHPYPPNTHSCTYRIILRPTHLNHPFKWEILGSLVFSRMSWVYSCMYAWVKDERWWTGTAKDQTLLTVLLLWLCVCVRVCFRFFRFWMSYHFLALS